MNNAMMTKKELRRLVRDRLDSLGVREREERSSAIRSMLASDRRIGEAGTIALFASLPDEPDLLPLIESLSVHHRVVVPFIKGDEMDFREYAPDRMRAGKYSIPEPEGTTEVMPSEIDLMVVPGRAFTPDGRRCGRGKGYYDRYMARPGFRAATIGVCFAEQFLEDIPTDEHDCGVDRVIWR